MASWSLPKKQEKFNDGDDDFQEEDVWFALKAREMKSKAKSGSSSSSSPPSAWQYSSAALRAIHRGRNDAGDMSLAKRSSAPMNIPDWSKIYGKKKMRKGDDDGSGEGGDCDVNVNGYDDDRDRHRHGDEDEEDEDEDEDEDGMVPPHEWLARKLGRSQISSFSVCEGIGRTLKGRDLSRVRNAILTKTGFLE